MFTGILSHLCSDHFCCFNGFFSSGRFLVSRDFRWHLQFRVVLFAQINEAETINDSSTLVSIQSAVR